MDKLNNENHFLEIDLISKIHNLWKHKSTIIKSIPIGIICGIIVAFSIPKSYEVEVLLSPESGTNNGNGNIAGVASMLGINSISGVTGQDALNISMFPDIITSTPFILEMFNVSVTTSQNEVLAFSDYLNTEEKAWWTYIFTAPRNIISLFQNKSSDLMKEEKINPFQLTHKQYSQIQAMKQIFQANIDKESQMTKIKVSLQDPKVAAIIADSVTYKLQKYITDYKTRKAKEDYDFINKLCNERKVQYHHAQQEYASFLDANKNISTQASKTIQDRLQNEVNLALQVYSQLEGQLQIASAKVQEAKPIFAIVEPPTIPLIPKFPNKTLIVIICTILFPFITGLWFMFIKNIISQCSEYIRTLQEIS